MELNPNTGTFISLQEAKTYVAEYKRMYPESLTAYFAGSSNLKEIIDQAGCVGLRMYNGYCVDDKTTNLVIIGVDANQEDMTSGLILEKLAPCPTNCDPTGGLGG
jgi:hypothetical protein